jgi:Asp/Glu/hydantoin racemase
MRLLLINPNTTAAITQRMATLARGIVAPTTEIVAVTGRFGARYVASRAAYAIAAHAALDAYASAVGADARDVDGVVLACFGDPGLPALKEIAGRPVVGMAEASYLAAIARGGRFAIVTGGDRWGPMLTEHVAGVGLATRLTTVVTVAPAGADIARDPDAAMALLTDACRACVEVHGADVVILAGAGLAGLAAQIGPRVPVPIVDSLAACLLTAEALVRLDSGIAHVGSFSLPPPVDAVGLSPELATLLAGRDPP